MTLWCSLGFWYFSGLGRRVAPDLEAEVMSEETFWEPTAWIRTCEDPYIAADAACRAVVNAPEMLL
jgi:hypothetical protein